MALQNVPEDLDIDATILRVYDRMMQTYLREKSELDSADLIELAYADLDKDPLGTLERIYSHLNLEGFQAACPAFSNYLGSVQSFQKNAFKGDQEIIDKVHHSLGNWIEHWGYRSPDLRSGTCA
jgi:hypothetical protein